uniref:WKF domain-containing protein n=1 Tax=Heliothis virescens TaxID=7102 RepID=A0A2A4JLE8_HELVI
MTNNYKKKNKNKKKKQLRAKNVAAGEERPEDHQDHVEDQGNESDDQGEPASDKPVKRQHENDDDSDAEDKPRRKKKKKQPVATESTDKKGQKSIRQMKREKYAARQAEAQSAAKDQLKGQCINYLSQWKHDKQNWKFMKTKQVWLYKNKFSTHLVPDSSWPLLLEYFESAQGNIRNMLLNDANKIIKQMDEWTESQNGDGKNKESQDGDEEENEDDESGSQTKKPDDNVYKRARDLIQCLEE